ncbi:hypothetical protein WI95_21430 [Burkholderia contaminans]|nr:hypothetical protein WI95_21430 [Burkholderia contaminans]TCW63856.1 hypothetical protein C5O79_33435 [Burkholderia sp. SRS-25]
MRWRRRRCDRSGRKNGRRRSGRLSGKRRSGRAGIRSSGRCGCWRTAFSARGLFKPVRQIGLWLALQQAHRYAVRNWRHLAMAAQGQAGEMAPAR